MKITVTRPLSPYYGQSLDVWITMGDGSVSADGGDGAVWLKKGDYKGRQRRSNQIT